MSPKEKNGDRVLQAAAAQSWTRGFQRCPVVTVDARQLYDSVQAMTPAQHQQYPWGGLIQKLAWYWKGLFLEAHEYR